MAFNRAAGYNNLPSGAFSPVIYSQKVLKFFRKASVVEDITNTDYYGEIANFGDTVKIIREPTLTVTPYTRGTTVNPQDLADDELSLTVDKANYFAFKVDDIEQKQAHLNWESLATSSGAYAIRDGYDTEVLSHISGQVLTANQYGTGGSPLDLGHEPTDTATPLQAMNRIVRLMDANNVPAENRWFVAGPLFWEQMRDENSKLMGVDFTGDSNSILRNGLVTNGLIRGFRCYQSNNLPLDSSNNVALAGHMSAVATASQISKVETFRDPDSFADVVRGLHMYGRKVLRTEGVYKIVYSID